MLPDLDSLALFMRAAEMKNLTRAAEASLITVPAASRRLSLLEHQFKAQLFARHSRGLDLTPAGERLLQLAREVIASVHHMRAQMSNYGRGQQAVLRVHGNTSAMTQFLPGDIATFSPGHPDVRVVARRKLERSGGAPRAQRRGRLGRHRRRPSGERSARRTLPP
jgi:DNA-binding transcriptional LysR family regulator